jgi:hypothetical protein
MTHKVRFANIDLPEGFVVFAVPKNVLGDTYTYNDNENPMRGLLVDHNIQEVEVSFGGKEFFHKEPHNGQLFRDVINYKHLMDYLHAPPFGVEVNPELFTLDRIVDGCVQTAYPHVYMNLRNTKDGERMAPVHEDGSITAQKKDLDILLKFNADGAKENATYMVYAFYTDTYMEMHLLPDRDIAFVNPYHQKV